MANCDYCGVGIYWVRQDGRSIPMETTTRKQHVCTKKPVMKEPQIKRCNRCGAEIYFKEREGGGWDAMDYETDERHKCTGQAQDRDRAWQEDQEQPWRRKKY